MTAAVTLIQLATREVASFTMEMLGTTVVMGHTLVIGVPTELQEVIHATVTTLAHI